MSNLKETLEFLQREEPKKTFNILADYEYPEEEISHNILCIDSVKDDKYIITQQYIESACMRWLIDNKFKPTNQRYISGVLHIENLTVNDYFRYSEDLSIDSIIKLANEMNK